MKKRILVVEDDPATIVIYRAILGTNDYEVFSAGNAKNAIDILNNESVDLIIEDLSLPDLNGIQLLHCIRQIPKCATLPVIILSGSSGRIESAKKSTEHFEAFLHKPVNQEELLAVVKKLLS